MSRLLVIGIMIMVCAVMLSADDFEETLWDSCDSIDVMAPIFWQTAWDPNATRGSRVGTMSVDTEEKIEGAGSIHWVVTADEISEWKSRDPIPQYVMINRLYGQPWPVKEMRFHIKSENPNQPAVYALLLSYGRADSIQILDKGEVTDGWKEIRWDMANVEIGEDEFGKLMWFFRIFSRTDWFEEGQSLDIRLDNIRLITEPAVKITDEPQTDIILTGSYVVWPKAYTEKGSVDSLPTEGETGKDIRVFGSRGEYVPASFSVRAVEKDLQGVSVSLADDFKSSDGVIPKASAEIKVVKSMKRWLSVEEYIPTETYLVSENSADVPSGVTERFWIMIKIPDDAKPGVYSSEIAINPQNDEPSGIPISIEVLPFELAEAKDMAYFMYYSPHFMPEQFRTEEYQRKVFADMKEHGMTTVTTYFHPRNDLLKGTLDGYLPIEPTMEALNDIGLVADGLPVIWIGAESYGADYWLPILEAQKSRNWPEFAFYMVDEPNQQRYPAVEAVMARLAEFRANHPDVEVRTTTAMGVGAINDIGHYYDIWICNAGSLKDDSYSVKAKDEGKELWVYECNYAPTSAANSRFYFGYWAWKADVKGCAYWAYYDGAFYNRFGSIGSYDDVQKNRLEWTNHFNFVYPADEGLIPTISWEAVRQGIYDYRYLATLEKAILSAEGSKAKEAEDLLANIKEMIGIGDYYNPPHEDVKDRKDSAIFDRRPPDIGFDWDEMRRRIADMIIALSNN